MKSASVNWRTTPEATHHAWAIESYQSLVWRGEFTPVVLGGWTVLAALGAAGLGVALMLERRRG